MLKLGSAGDDVGRLHQALIEAGYTVPLLETSGSAFGPGTLAAVKSFQSAQGLLVDGVAGPQTLERLESPHGTVVSGWRYDSNNVPQQCRPATDAAVGEIGQREDPPHSNRVANNRYKNGTAAWCAYFVSWAMGHCDGGSPFGVKDSAWSIWSWAKQHDRFVHDLVRAGDVFCILRGDPDKGFCHGHVGLVTGVLPDGRMMCVEGNASDSVKATIRKRGDVYCLVRPL